MEIDVTTTRTSMPKCVDVGWKSPIGCANLRWIMTISETADSSNRPGEEWCLMFTTESSLRIDTSAFSSSPVMTLVGHQDVASGRDRSYRMHRIDCVGTAALQTSSFADNFIASYFMTHDDSEFFVIDTAPTTSAEIPDVPMFVPSRQSSARRSTRSTVAAGVINVAVEDVDLERGENFSDRYSEAAADSDRGRRTGGFLSCILGLFGRLCGKTGERDEDIESAYDRASVVVPTGSPSPSVGHPDLSRTGSFVRVNSSRRSVRSSIRSNNNNNINSVVKRPLVRLRKSAGKAFEPIAVNVGLNKQTTQLTATVSWQYNGSDQSVDKWHLTIINMTWSQGDGCTYHRWIMITDADVRSLALPFWFQTSNRYRVTVSGLMRCVESQNGVVQIDNVVCKGTTEFRAGPVLSKTEVQQLHFKALDFVSNKENGDAVSPCYCVYRNKPAEHFKTIRTQHGGIMPRFLKDASGDVRSPINGQLCGLFFCANAKKNGQPLHASPFGDTRLIVDVDEILRMAPNIYFADFYCMFLGGPHYVILVLTFPGTEDDQFCTRNLPRLSVDDQSHNPFLFREDGQMYVTDHTVMVEVFYTASDLDIRKYQVVGGIQPIKKGTSTQGGLGKSPGCWHCDVSQNRRLLCQQRNGYELF